MVRPGQALYKPAMLLPSSRRWAGFALFSMAMGVGSACVNASPSTNRLNRDAAASTDEGVGDLSFQPEVGLQDTGSGAAADLGENQGPTDSGSVPDSGPVDIGVAQDAGAPVNPLDGQGAPQEIASDYDFLEGPKWYKGNLLFTDIPANTIYQLEANGSVSVFRRPSNNANGLAVDTQDRLLAAEHGTRRVSRATGTDAPATLVDRYEGDRLNSPNDLTVRSDGTVYFTDPEWGIADSPELHELDFNGVFKVDPGGDLSVQWSTPWRGHNNTPRPNGIVLSEDERTLYVAVDNESVVMVFDVAVDGSLSAPRARWRTSSVPDGMAMDTAGNLYVATSAGVEVFAPVGSKWGTISVPRASNVTFGGADAKILYITAGSSLHSVRLSQEGIR